VQKLNWHSSIAVTQVSVLALSELPGAVDKILLSLNVAHVGDVDNSHEKIIEWKQH
jgi:hypothetical protein